VDGFPHRTEGDGALLSFIPKDARRILDLGTGDGRLLALLLIDRPEAEGVALDFSPTMLEAARQRFAGNTRVRVVKHNLDQTLPELGKFDAIVSGFAIHHSADVRKREIYAEVFAALSAGGVFCNLEHVASATPALHRRFLEAFGTTPEQEDPSNKLAPVEVQLAWLREIGFADVDCYWKWMELALFGGIKPKKPDWPRRQA
jgi:SAM-dependent methyltransferase